MAKKANQKQTDDQMQQDEVLAVDDPDLEDEDDDEVIVVTADDFEDGYIDPEQIIEQNQTYLTQFLEDLEKAGLKDSTIGRHVSNADLFINGWLAGHEGLPMDDGPEQIGNFLGNWYIRRCMWSNPSNIKTTAASIKKFYKSMLDRGNIDKGDYEYLLGTIKADMEDWQYKCALYNDRNTEWDDIAHLFITYF